MLAGYGYFPSLFNLLFVFKKKNINSKIFFFKAYE